MRSYIAAVIVKTRSAIHDTTTAYQQLNITRSWSADSAILRLPYPHVHVSTYPVFPQSSHGHNVERKKASKRTLISPNPRPSSTVTLLYSTARVLLPTSSKSDLDPDSGLIPRKDKEQEQEQEQDAWY